MDLERLRSYLPRKQELKQLQHLRDVLLHEAELDERRGWIKKKDQPSVYWELVALYERLIQEARQDIQEIEAAVYGLPDGPGRDVLRLHYLEGVKMEQVAELLCYSWESIYRHRKKAIAML